MHLFIIIFLSYFQLIHGKPEHHDPTVNLRKIICIDIERGN
jgi:hypothetical protein